MKSNLPYQLSRTQTRFLYRWPILPLFTILVLSCGKKQSAEPPHPTTTDTATVAVSKVFGFDGQQRYAYCPSVISQGSTRHIWFCGNEPAGVFSDHIYYIRGDSTTVPKIVLAPGPAGTWDDRHVCDPSVIKGKFNFNGTTYQYAMFYLGNRTDRYYNEIGVAFAQSPDADAWVKYPDPLVPKTWAGDQDMPVGGGQAWGVGEPSAISADHQSKILLTYTIGDANGTRVVVRQADLSDMTNIQLGQPTIVSTAGLTKLDYSTGNIVLSNADFATDSNRTTVYMTSAVLPVPASYPAFIPAAVDLNRMAYSHSINGTGTWTAIERIGPTASGFPRNHNSGLGRDAYGAISDLQHMEHYFTVSRADPDVSPQQNALAEWTYQIYVDKNIDLTKP